MKRVVTCVIIGAREARGRGYGRLVRQAIAVCIVDMLVGMRLAARHLTFGLRPYIAESTRSHPNSEVKQQLAQLVLRWGTTLEPCVLQAFAFCSPHHSSFWCYITTTISLTTLPTILRLLLPPSLLLLMFLLYYCYYYCCYLHRSY